MPSFRDSVVSAGLGGGVAGRFGMWRMRGQIRIFLQKVHLAESALMCMPGAVFPLSPFLEAT